MTGISSSNSVFSISVVGSLDSETASWYFTLARRSISKYYPNGLGFIGIAFSLHKLLEICAIT